MAYKATLSVNGTDYDVVSCNYMFNQNIGTDGRPTSDVNGGQVSVSVLSSGNTGLVEWMADKSKTYDGKVTFYQFDNSDQVLKELDFTKAFCVGYTETFSNAGNMVESIYLSAQKLTIGNAEHDNDWPS
jgi:hypothetical protein